MLTSPGDQKLQRKSSTKIIEYNNTTKSTIKQAPLEAIKENAIDLSYLKKVKSKVDCWTSNMNGPIKSSRDSREIMSSRNKRMTLSPQKSFKKLSNGEVKDSQASLDKKGDLKIKVEATQPTEASPEVKPRESIEDMCN